MDLIRQKVVTELSKYTHRSIEVEEQIYNDTCDYCKKNNILLNKENVVLINIYLEFSRSLIHNINEDSYIKNKTLRELINSDKIKLSKISSYDKNSNKWRKFKEDLDLLEKEISNINPDVATTTQFVCSKCRKNTKCCYYSMQTRSADEPMTNFITCIECNHNWRE